MASIPLIVIYWILTIVFLATVIYTFLLLSKSGKTIEIVLRTRPVFYIGLEIGLLFHLFFLNLFFQIEPSRSGCLTLKILENFFMNLAIL